MVRMTNLKSKTKWLYYLIDPRDNVVKYVGISRDPVKRLQNHKQEKSNKGKLAWIKELKKMGLSPELRFVTEADDKQAKALESKHIRKFGLENLFNKRAEDLSTKLEMRVDLNELIEIKTKAEMHTDGNVSEYIRTIITEINNASPSEIQRLVDLGKEKIRKRKHKGNKKCKRKLGNKFLKD